MNLPHDAKVWCPCCIEARPFSIETPRPDANGVWAADMTCDACHLVIATFHCTPAPDYADVLPRTAKRMERMMRDAESAPEAKETIRYCRVCGASECGHDGYDGHAFAPAPAPRCECGHAERMHTMDHKACRVALCRCLAWNPACQGRK